MAKMLGKTHVGWASRDLLFVRDGSQRRYGWAGPVRGRTVRRQARAAERSALRRELAR